MGKKILVIDVDDTILFMTHEFTRLLVKKYPEFKGIDLVHRERYSYLGEHIINGKKLTITPEIHDEIFSSDEFFSEKVYYSTMILKSLNVFSMYPAIDDTDIHIVTSAFKPGNAHSVNKKKAVVRLFEKLKVQYTYHELPLSIPKSDYIVENISPTVNLMIDDTLHVLEDCLMNNDITIHTYWLPEFKHNEIDDDHYRGIKLRSLVAARMPVKFASIEKNFERLNEYILEL